MQSVTLKGDLPHHPPVPPARLGAVWLLAPLLALVGAAPAAAQSSATLQVAARVVSNAPSQTALGLARLALAQPAQSPSRSGLARVLVTPLPAAAPDRRGRVVRIDFLRN